MHRRRERLVFYVRAVGLGCSPVSSWGRCPPNIHPSTWFLLCLFGHNKECRQGPDPALKGMDNEGFVEERVGTCLSSSCLVYGAHEDPTLLPLCRCSTVSSPQWCFAQPAHLALRLQVPM